MDVNHKLYNINGFNLLVLSNSTNNCSVKSFIDTGYINEDENNLGINHLLEHVLVNGNNLCNNDCITFMNKKGIIMNASTGLNIVSYFTEGLIDDFNKMVDFILSTSLNIDNISEKVIEKEKKAVLEELLTHSNNSMASLNYNLYLNSFKYYGLQNFFNYEKQINNLKKLDKNTLINFYKKNYNKILFVVSCNLDNDYILNLFTDKLSNYSISNKNLNIDNCFSFKKGAFFLENKVYQNTTISILFPSLIENNHKNNVLLNIITKYLKNYCMDILRSKKNLIYGIEIHPGISYCGTSIYVTINVNNNNAKKTLDEFMKIIKECKSSIDENFINGVKKNYKYLYNLQNEKEITNFYEKIYINKLFNNCREDIIDYNNYNELYINFEKSDIIELINKLFNFDKMVLVYKSKQSMV